MYPAFILRLYGGINLLLRLLVLYKIVVFFQLRAIKDCLCSFWPKPQKEPKMLLRPLYGPTHNGLKG
jgi:hypothetical protein